MTIETRDYVEATYKGIQYDGVIKSIDIKHNEAVIAMEVGVEMLLPMEDMTLLRKYEVPEDQAVMGYMGHA